MKNKDCNELEDLSTLELKNLKEQINFILFARKENRRVFKRIYKRFNDNDKEI